MQNRCSVEFDPFGFLVKDLRTKAPLIRCNSTRPLYAVTPHSPPHTALLTSLPASLWHNRLGHPGEAALRFLASSGFFKFSKADVSSLCHACQLGKHTRQPFFSSNSVVSEPFEIIHSDVWTSPVSSISGIKYYVIFLDQFSHFVWIYPLRQKSEVFSKFLHFSNFVKTQFQKQIKAFKSDNGGEFNNRAMLDFVFLTMEYRPGFHVRTHHNKTDGLNGHCAPSTTWFGLFCFRPNCQPHIGLKL